MDRRGTLLVVLVAGAAGFGAGFLAGEARQADPAHRRVPGGAGPSLATEHLTADRAAGRPVAHTDPTPVLEGAPAPSEMGRSAAPPPSRLTTVSLAVDVVDADGAPSPGHVLAMRSPASADDWSRARRVQHAGRATLTLPASGVYDLLLVCKEPHGWLVQRDVQVGRDAEIRLRLPTAAPLVPRLPEDAGDWKSPLNVIGVSLVPEDEDIPREVLLEAAFLADWTIDATVAPPRPLLLPGCAFRAHLSSRHPWRALAARPPLLQAGDDMEVLVARRRTVELVVDIDRRDVFGDGTIPWRARYFADGRQVAAHDGQHRAHEHTRGGRPREPDWSVLLADGTYELVVDSPFTSTYKDAITVGPTQSGRVVVELETPDRLERDAQALDVRVLPGREAVPLDDAEVVAVFQGVGSTTGTVWTRPVDPEGRAQLPAVWRAATWICVKSGHAVTDWARPPRAGDLTLALREGGYVILVPRVVRRSHDQPSFLGNLRRPDGQPLIEDGDALEVIEEPWPGSLIGPLPAGPITLVSDVLGGGQMEHVVDVRAKATTVLWMD